MADNCKLPYRFENFPAELRRLKQWVGWRLEDSDKRERCKVPKTTTGLGASSTNPEHWASLDEALRHLPQPIEKYKDEPYSRGVGCVCADGYVGVDLDHCYDEPSATLDDFAQQFLAKLPPTYTELTPSRSGLHLWYKLPENYRPEKSGLRTKRAEVYFRDRYLTVTGWKAGNCPESAHHLTSEQVQVLIDAVEATREKTIAPSASVPRFSSNKYRDYMTRHDFADLSAVVHALVVMLLRKHSLSAAKADEEFRTSAIFKNTHWQEKWERLGKQEIEKCLPLAKEWLERDAKRLQDSSVYGPHKVAGELLLEMYGDDIRYDFTSKKFRLYTGGVWAKDEKDFVLELMNEVTKRLLEDAKSAGADQKALLKIVTALSNADTREKSARWARSSPRVATTLAEYDTQKNLFNCANGTLDLDPKVLAFREHRREDLLTKRSPVSYDPSATCPTFDAYLRRAIPKEEVRNFLQESAGYTLTGWAFLKYFWLLRGPKDSTKTTLIETIRFIMGDYAIATSFKNLSPSESQNTPGIARLRGARFASAVEGEENKQLDGANLKRLVGGKDKITAMAKYENETEFEATHKIWLASNYPPLMNSNDDALWRRVLEVPFLISIPLAEQDANFDKKLEAEASGILNWMIEGWKRVASREPMNILVPDEVRLATEQLRDETDPIRNWFEARCEITNNDKEDRLSVEVAWNNFIDYLRPTKPPASMKKNSFSAHVAKRILKREKADHSRSGNCYFGVKLRSPMQAQFEAPPDCF